MGTVRELDQKAIAQRVKEARVAGGLTRRELARLAGLTEQTCLRAEDPAGKPSPSALEPISQVLSVSLGELLYGKPDEFFSSRSAKLDLFELLAELDEKTAATALPGIQAIIEGLLPPRGGKNLRKKRDQLLDQE